MSVLLRQPHGFEGLRVAHEELLVDHQPVPVTRTTHASFPKGKSMPVERPRIRRSNS